MQSHQEGFKSPAESSAGRERAGTIVAPRPTDVNGVQETSACRVPLEASHLASRSQLARAIGRLLQHFACTMSRRGDLSLGKRLIVDQPMENPCVNLMECRIGCGACCIAPSISSPIPGMPNGKPAGLRCVQLTWDNRCLLFGLPERPAVCVRLRAEPEMCGSSAGDALIFLAELELLTGPNPAATRS